MAANKAPPFITLTRTLWTATLQTSAGIGHE
jgi:hypothetical protein